MTNKILSICITTYNRARYITETLDSILNQIKPGIEVIVVDGFSPDNTPEIMSKYIKYHPEVKYFREKENSGIDGDYDKAVNYASGEFCWLMTDDDLLVPNAIQTVLSHVDDTCDLLVVDTEVRTADLKESLEPRRLNFEGVKNYGPDDTEIFFIDIADHLSFIGGVIIRKSIWLSRNRKQYYGTVFIHVGVIFQKPAIKKVRVIGKSLILIRYGNAMWTPRSFQIWNLKWPKLIWSFPEFSEKAKMKICLKEPWKDPLILLKHRARGSYTLNEFQVLRSECSNLLELFMPFIIVITPAKVINFLAVLFVLVFKRKARLGLYDLLNSPHVNQLSILLAKFSGLQVTIKNKTIGCL